MMRVVISFFLGLVFLLGGFVVEINAERNGVYIVYMGASPHSSEHASILSSLMTRKKKGVVVHTYSNGFSGFAAHLTEEEAKSIAKREGVVSVFPDPILQLHTTRSWEFLSLQKEVKIDSSSSSTPSPSSGGADAIVGILDTGIWPESDSFKDVELGPIPSSWKGRCMEGLNFTTSNCNRKIIGARYYDDEDSDTSNPTGTPRDQSGHGTHVASTVAGRPVTGASYYGLATGTAAGGSPGARIAMYRVCLPGRGCAGSAILKAFDDAIADGVDILSLSLGGSAGQPNFDTDPIAIGAFHATEKGILVVCSAGNSGPESSSVVNTAPWILTVAATTIDRDFETRIQLGGNKIIKGGGINFSSLNKTSTYPLIDGLSAKSASADSDEADARNCLLGSLDDNKVIGKIVVCENEDRDYPAPKFSVIKSQGAIGMILVDNNHRQVAQTYGVSPISVVTEDDGAQILSYIKSTSNPLATILPTEVIQNYKPAPAVAYFSSRGPTYGIRNLIKPDISAPGVAILAAWPSNDGNEALPAKDPPHFYIISGTSMSCPHVSGLAAKVKSQNPKLSASGIRSAIMTTAYQTNNLDAPIGTNDGSIATPYDIGAGEITVTGPMQPGLVYETETTDYLEFLCNLGYDTNKIRSIASNLPSTFSCPSSSKPDSISNMNYPSIALYGLTPDVVKTVNRTVTNVGGEDSTYSSMVEAPASLQVQVVPKELHFTKNVNKLSFQVTFKVAVNLKEEMFGSLTWSNEKYKVRSPFVVSN